MIGQIFNRFVAAEWIDNLKKFEAPEQKGVVEFRPLWRKGTDDKIEGAVKVIAFAQLYRELLKGGPMTIDEINLIADYGTAMSQEGSGKI